VLGCSTCNMYIWSSKCHAKNSTKLLRFESCIPTGKLRESKRVILNLMSLKVELRSKAGPSLLSLFVFCLFCVPLFISLVFSLFTSFLSSSSHFLYFSDCFFVWLFFPLCTCPSFFFSSLSLSFPLFSYSISFFFFLFFVFFLSLLIFFAPFFSFYFCLSSFFCIYFSRHFCFILCCWRCWATYFLFI
jgi:hypothetical protein